MSLSPEQVQVLVEIRENQAKFKHEFKNNKSENLTIFDWVEARGHVEKALEIIDYLRKVTDVQVEEIRLRSALIQALFDRTRGRVDLPFSHELWAAENALNKFRRKQAGT